MADLSYCTASKITNTHRTKYVGLKSLPENIDKNWSHGIFPLRKTFIVKEQII